MSRAAAFVFALLLLPNWVSAQVVVNHAALYQLAGIVPTPPPAVTAPPPAVRHITLRRRRTIRKPPPGHTGVAKPQPVVAIAPLATKPATIHTPPAAAITFAPGAADLPAGAPAALKPFCGAASTIIISAAAPVDPADPSSAMRLAMLRAFAVRAALIACGTSSANILPRTATSTLAKNPDATQITENR